MAQTWRPVVRQHSRSGCANCKERRIKCGEEKPACLKCVTRGYTCPGYAKRLQWKGKHQLFPIYGADAQHDTATTSTFPDHESLAIIPHSHLPPSISDEQTLLIKYYFNSVCVINSCYDSPLNPLRTGVHTLISSSRLIHLCVLSMSAAHLRHKDRQWSLSSLEYLTEAVSTLATQLSEALSGQSSTCEERKRDEVLLGVIMLGMSTSWHVTCGLGLEHISGSRALFQNWIYRHVEEKRSAPDWRRLSFYLSLQAYWETAASFLIDQDPDKLDHIYQACMALPVYPVHIQPWTGISCVPWVLLAKAGCIARSKRRIVSRYYPRDQLRYAIPEGATLEHLEQEARRLEAKVMKFTLPDVSQIESTHDQQTPIKHLVALSQCCMLAALLELYQAFGGLCGEWSLSSLLNLSEGVTLCKDSPLEGSQQTYTSADIISGLSLCLLRTLQSIPRDSNTRCLHPILLLIAGSALSTRVSNGSRLIESGQELADATIGADRQLEFAPVKGVSCSILFESHAQSTSKQSVSLTKQATMKAWRVFVFDRIKHLEQVINLDCIRRIRMILQGVWAQDNVLASRGSGGDIGYVHWIDVMEQEKLHFLF